MRDVFPRRTGAAHHAINRAGNLVIQGIHALNVIVAQAAEATNALDDAE